MDDIRLNGIGRAEWYPVNHDDGKKKRPRHPHQDAEPEPVDEVILSSETAEDRESED